MACSGCQRCSPAAAVRGQGHRRDVGICSQRIDTVVVFARNAAQVLLSSLHSVEIGAPRPFPGSPRSSPPARCTQTKCPSGAGSRSGCYFEHLHPEFLPSVPWHWPRQEPGPAEPAGATAEASRQSGSRRGRSTRREARAERVRVRSPGGTKSAERG